MSEVKAYVADAVFTGESWLPAYAVITQAAVSKVLAAEATTSNNTSTGALLIHSLVPVAQLPAGIEVVEFKDAIICPAFIDVQVYGASQHLFSAWPEPGSLQLLAEHNRKGGTALCLPTIATNSMDIVKQGIDAMREYWRGGGTGIYGLHLEGPWINVTKKGAHMEEYITKPDLNEVKQLLDYGEGVIRMITLAPECCDAEVIRYILSRGIRVSAGHSNASYRQAMDAFDDGITTVTHLFNAMSPLQHRAPGLAGAAMDHASVMASIIPDGIHVDFAAVRIAQKLMQGRLFVITDAVTETAVGPYQHVKAGDWYESSGILSGSALQMNVAVRNLVEQAGIDMDEAIRMCSLYSARMLGIDHTMGMLQPGYQFTAVVLNRQLDVLDVLA